MGINERERERERERDHVCVVVPSSVSKWNQEVGRERFLSESV